MASTASSSTLKILTVGSALGTFRDLFSKVKAIDSKHGRFDLVLCVGDFFRAYEGDFESESDLKQLLEGNLDVPLPCYLMQGEHPLPQAVIEKFSKTGGELCDNVFLLSKSAVFSTAEGLRIGCLGGTYDPKIYNGAELPQGFSSPFFSSQTVSKLLSNTLTTAAPRTSSLSSIMSSASSSSLLDILITHIWPSAITEHSKMPLPFPNMSQIGAPPVDEVILKTKPRYIFSSSGGQPPHFWEREPFIWSDEEGRASRFVGLGAFGGEQGPGKKQRESHVANLKWFYAFSISPQSLASATPARPSNATANPFTEISSRSLKRRLGGDEGENYRWGAVSQSGKRSRTMGGEQGKPPSGYRCRRCDSTDHYINDCPERTKPPDGYVCKICNTPGHLVRDCPTRNAVGDTGGKKPREGYVCRACGSELHYIDDCPLLHERRTVGEEGWSGNRGPLKEITPDQCWFCLSNPKLAKYLIVAIGSECYVTLPKGQLIPTHGDGDYKSAKVPQVPGGGHVLIVPIAHFTTLSSIPSSLKQSVLNECHQYKTALRAFYAKHAAIPVFFEVGRLSAKGGHAHVQVIPIPRDLIDKVESAFIDEGKKNSIEFDVEEPDSEFPGAEAGSYFRVDLPDGRRLVHWLQDGVPFSLQFGRQVISSLLGLEDRLDWKACLQSEEDDKADVTAFKEAFAPFDPIA